MGQAANPEDTLFTQQVYRALVQGLAEASGPFDSEDYQLYQKRRYPREGIGHEIAFDVAIEHRHPGQKGLPWSSEI